METKKNCCDYVESRNRDLQNTFNKLMASRSVSTGDIFGRMTRMPAPRFYINEERAYALILGRLLHARRGVSMESRVEMVDEIERRVRKLLAEDPSLTVKDAVYKVVNSPAPAFFLTKGSIRTLVYRTLRA